MVFNVNVYSNKADELLANCLITQSENNKIIIKIHPVNSIKPC